MDLFIGGRSDEPPKHQKYTINYRLTDIESSQLPGVEAGEWTAEQKKVFYALQAEALFDNWQRFQRSHIHVNVLIPSIKSANELQEIKTAISLAAQKYGVPEEAYGFGAMLETEEAIRPANAAGIAMLCNFVCFGTNDLTSQITEIPRDDLDPAVQARCKRYMDDLRAKDTQFKHIPGDSPFDVLVPDVIRRMRVSIADMRTANPNLKITCCGRQVSGNAHSIEECVQMDLDGISVAPQDAMASRIMAAHYRAERNMQRNQGQEAAR